eukprot:TRINITY_DN5869_c0_g2_i1.p1 TRINITY_DN5869_c0_g2~~TRINITY_DN5869_c0_g2_i1.p1  ORF type:complete len:513 (+),score=29.88 TRINITY_DN5869_c0_g2_i1:50-1540(+)
MAEHRRRSTFLIKSIGCFIFSWIALSTMRWLYANTSLCFLKESADDVNKDVSNDTFSVQSPFLLHMPTVHPLSIATLSKAGFWQGDLCYSGQVFMTGPIFRGLPDPHSQSGVTYLAAGIAYVVQLDSYGMVDGQWACGGGNFYEVDLSGVAWKQRLRMADYGNGTYEFTVFVSAEFSGPYTLSVRMLYEHYRGLRIRDYMNRTTDLKTILHKKLLLHLSMPLVTTPDVRATGLQDQQDNPAPQGHKPVQQAHKPRKQEHEPEEQERKQHNRHRNQGELAANISKPLLKCRLSDFRATLWEGRWVRLLPEGNAWDHFGWASGNISGVHSRGWVYSHKCYFHIYEQAEAWSCLKGKTVLFWGDSNFQDTARNLMEHVFGQSTVHGTFLRRNFDVMLTSPFNSSQHIQMTLLFNGHPNMSKNGLGLHTFDDPQAVMRLKKMFLSRKPDFVIMTSGLHDGIYMVSILDYILALDRALDIWEETLALLPMKPRISAADAGM